MGIILAAIEVLFVVFLFMMIGKWYIGRHWDEM